MAIYVYVALIATWFIVTWSVIEANLNLANENLDQIELRLNETKRQLNGDIQQLEQLNRRLEHRQRNPGTHI